MPTPSLRRPAAAQVPNPASVTTVPERAPADSRGATFPSPFAAVAPARDAPARLIPVRWTADGALLLV